VTDSTRQQLNIPAPPSAVLQVIADIGAYPEWIDDVKEVEILQHDDAGNVTRAAFKASGFGRSISYTLVYDWSAAPDEVQWSQESSDVTSRLDGSYELDEVAGTTDVTYRLGVDLKVPLPSFLKRRAESKIVATALEQLKTETLRRQRSA
jgi:hypothetical protein